MVKKCVAYGCNNVASKEDGISLHRFPKNPERRKQWNINIAATRADWTDASEHSVLCSAHFVEDDFEIKPRLCAEFDIATNHERVLKLTAIPTIFFKRPVHGSGSAMPCSTQTKQTAVIKRQRARVNEILLYRISIT